MSKLSHQAKVYNMLLSAGIGNSVEVDQLLAIEGLLPYKLSAYVLYAKIDYGAVILPVRDGRKVVAYQMMDAGNGLSTRKTAVAKAPKAVKTAVKAAKTPAKTVPVVAQSEMKSDPIVRTSNRKIVDVLDEMDTDVISFEDRAFVEEFVRSL